MKHTLLTAALIGLSGSGAMAQATCATAFAGILRSTCGTNFERDRSHLICAGASTVAGTGAWYTFTPAEDTTVTVSSAVIGLPFVDTRMHVYTGTCAALMCHSGDDDSGPGYSSMPHSRYRPVSPAHHSVRQLLDQYRVLIHHHRGLYSRSTGRGP
ncbi:MAG: hypothetical protein IPO05_07250 [Flavobacteriales bacterium]|nr:hypothetical protein [Flavobacteriales bacterium]